jgi:uncharacterized OB-fold protein
MHYDQWIQREKRVRAELLKASPSSKDGVFRICEDCGEVCLCHEDKCPNCNSFHIENCRLSVKDISERIRCQYRYTQLIE